jgi:hypothetical protein
MTLRDQIDNYRYARRYSKFFKGTNEVNLTDYIEFPKLRAPLQIYNSLMGSCVGLIKSIKKTLSASS